ncbi:F-box protein CPR1-like [Andrographis paniculata]|uniref:F-box protein CPR1-like n=1 Tax=Andrographis paniculata TaxID=175694 RepID=UPI0021E78B2D|nr:F-box protein CPR1-like [Andrographis paniculata]XP_051140768.1 F-box protein CPR1-like [Andrographis paniculata]
MEGPRNSFLPEDVIVDILLRLPVKTLSQFKCVCKHWCSIIGSSSFVNSHLTREHNQDRLLVRHYKPREGDNAYALYLDDTLSAYEEPDYLQIPTSVSSLMGPLNGIFCLIGMMGRIALMNPALRQFRPLPSVPPNVQPHLTTYDDLLGFGMDPNNGDFKVVLIQYFWNEDTDVPHFPSQVSVYSSSMDSWKQFENADLVNSTRYAFRSLCNTYLNGVYYWLTEFNETDVAILAFDMSTEKFQEIQVPDCIKSKEGDLALYQDSIALLSCDLDKEFDKCVDIWVMDKDECWTKYFTVGPFQEIKWPLGFWKNNELLLETGSSLLTLYDVFARRIRTVESLRKENGFFIYWIFTYKESLVSIKGDGNKCKLWDASSEIVKDFFKSS